MTTKDFIEDVQFETIAAEVVPSLETEIAESALTAEYEKVMDMNKILKNLLVVFPNGDFKKMEF